MLYFFLGSDECQSNLPIKVLWSDVAAANLSLAKPPDGYESFASGAEPAEQAPAIIYTSYELKMTQTISMPELGTHLYKVLFDGANSDLENAYTALCEDLQALAEARLGLDKKPRKTGVHRLFGYAGGLSDEPEVTACYQRLGVDADLYWLSLEKVDKLIAERKDSQSNHDKYLLQKRQQQREEMVRLGAQKLEEYRQDVDNWTLLLQLDSDFNAGICFWDAGLVHFLIDKNSLARREFLEVYAELSTF